MSDRDTIRTLNDRFRTTLLGGVIVLSQGIRAREDVAQIVERVRTFETFDEGHDPHGGHDFGALSHNAERVFWKIDYYDKGLRQGSPDPADPSVTTRVMTIMLAQEY